jgi:hypothetical protein
VTPIVGDDIGVLSGEFENNRLADPAIAAGDALQWHYDLLKSGLRRIPAGC